MKKTQIVLKNIDDITLYSSLNNSPSLFRLSLTKTGKYAMLTGGRIFGVGWFM